MKKTLIALAIMATMAGASWGAPVSPERAMAAGRGFMQAAGAKQAQTLRDVTGQTPFTLFYVLASDEGGFVVVSGDDRVQPILGYSTEALWPAGQLPDHVRNFLQGYEDGLAQLGDAPASARAAEQWAMLEAGQLPFSPQTDGAGYLLTTTWAQRPYYNDLCPYDSTHSERTVTGCVATATAQMMKYHNHPATGYGSHSYRATNDNGADYGTLTANFGQTTYQWSTMPAALTAASSTAQVQAVATLMSHVGIAVEMSYDVSSNGGSGAHNYYPYAGLGYASSQNALMSHFRYAPDMAVVERAAIDDATFAAAVRADIAASRPVLLSGASTSGGHSFVLDGYDTTGNFHINWGWGGSYDGYFALGDFAPSGAGTGASAENSYNLRNVALTHIRPNSSFGQGGTVSVTAATGGTANIGNGSTETTGSLSYAFLDTVTLDALASEGYRFRKWNDYSTQPQREFLGNGGNYTFSPDFELLAGDTMSYCGSRGRITSFSSTTFGIRIPASVLDASRVVKGAQFMPNAEGSFTLYVISGADTPTDTMGSATVQVTESMVGTWVTFGVEVGNSRVPAGNSLWLIFNTDAESSDYPASVCAGTGNADGLLLGPGLSRYYDYGYRYTLMIKALFGNPPAQPSASVSALATNATQHTATFTVTPNADCDVYAYYVTPSDLVDYYTDLYVSRDGEEYRDTYFHAFATHSLLVAKSDTLTGTATVTATGLEEGTPYGIYIHAENSSEHVNQFFLDTIFTMPYTVGGSGTATATVSHVLNTPDSVTLYFSFGPNTAFYRHSYITAEEWAYEGLTPQRQIDNLTALNSLYNWDIGTTMRGFNLVAGTYYFLVLPFNQNGEHGQLVIDTVVVPGQQPVPFSYSVGSVADHSAQLDITLGSTCDRVYYTAYPKGTVEGWMQAYGTSVTDELKEDLLTPYLPNVRQATADLAGQPLSGLLACGPTDTTGYIAYFTTTGTAPSISISVTAESGGMVSLDVQRNSVTNSYALLAINSDTLDHYYGIYGSQYSLSTIIASFCDTLYIGSAASHTFRLLPDAPYLFYGQAYGSVDTSALIYLDSVHTTSASAPVQYYTVTVLSNNEQMGLVSGGGRVQAGDSVTISAAALQGYRFVQWNDADTNAVRRVKVTADITYIATFEARTGIDEAGMEGICAYAEHLGIMLRGADGHSVELFDLQGRRLALRACATGEERFAVPAAGAYLLRFDGQGTRRVVVAR